MKRKTQRRELAAQFYRGNRLTFAVAAFAALTAGSLNLILSWLIQQLIDTASGMPNARPFGTLGLMDQLADALAQHGTAAGQAELAPLTEGIRMEHVSFSYEPGREVLHDVSTTFEAGKAYAVVGGSGSGKSTLLNLLMAAGDYQGSISLISGSTIPRRRLAAQEGAGR